MNKPDNQRKTRSDAEKWLISFEKANGRAPDFLETMDYMMKIFKPKWEEILRELNNVK